MRISTPDSIYAATSLHYSVLPEHSGCPAPRNIIADTGAAVDLYRDLHGRDKQRKTSEPIYFCTANDIIKADTIVQDYSSGVNKYFPMC